MGPSGSGKTTLLNLIAGLDRATRGEVIVHGQDLGELYEAEITRWRANNVGFIFQTYNLIPVLTAFENVELPLLLDPPLAAQAARERDDGACGSSASRGASTTIRASSPAARSSGWRSPGPSSPTPTCWSPTSRPATSTAPPPARSSTCSNSSTASSRRRSSWSPTTPWPRQRASRIAAPRQGPAGR